MTVTYEFFRGIFWSLVLLGSTAAPARGEIRVAFEMDSDPEIHVPAAVKVYSDNLLPLWRQALARPEADMQRMAAAAIGRGHAAGMPWMTATVPGLTAVATSPGSHSASRLAAAQALVELDARETAPQLAANLEKYGADFRQLVEPALAAWNYEPQRAAWLSRLTAPGVRHRDLVLAIRCLATAGDEAAAGELLDLVHDRFRPSDVRAEAARGAGLLRHQGLESAARRLTAGDTGPLLNRLCAVRLLARHTGDEAQILLTRFAVDPEPAVAAVALTRLVEIDPQLALPLAEGAMQNADPKVRQCGADAYVLVPDPERVAVLARLLDDPHPAVRASVRESLYDLARRAELDGPIRRAATEMLGGDRWRGLEQAAMLLVALGHKPAAGRLVELLEFKRPEVGIAAAWGLKTLAIPETLPAMFDKARRHDEIRGKLGPEPAGLDDQTAHLFEAFGRMKFTAAEALLAKYIPKSFVLGLKSRRSAIWSLGLLHEGLPDEGLARKLLERVADNGPPPAPPEFDAIKQVSAVSIARMKATSQAEGLRKFLQPVVQPGRLSMSIRWAVMELTGEQIPEPVPPRSAKQGWFLESLDG